MNAKYKFLFSVCIVLLFSFGSFIYGARKGVKEFQLADAKFQATIAAHRLRVLDIEGENSLRESFEIDLNDSLSKHYDYSRSRWRWLWPELDNKDEKYLLNAVNYRIYHEYTNPFDSYKESKEPLGEFERMLLSESAKMDEKVRNVLNVYRSKAIDPNLELYQSEKFNRSLHPLQVQN